MTTKWAHIDVAWNLIKEGWHVDANTREGILLMENGHPVNRRQLNRAEFEAFVALCGDRRPAIFQAMVFGAGTSSPYEARHATFGFAVPSAEDQDLAAEIGWSDEDDDNLGSLGSKKKW